MEEIRFITTVEKDTPSPCEKCNRKAKERMGCRYQNCFFWRNWFFHEWRSIQMMYAREYGND